MMSPAERMLIEHQCTKLVVQAMRCFDARDYVAFARLFAVDGQFVRATDRCAPLTGREAIAAALERRPASRFTRHLCTNIEVDVQDADHAQSVCYLLLYSATLTDPNSHKVLRADARQAVGEYHDRFVRTAEGWRIARREGTVLLETGDPQT
jgi:SnoaL-like domain